MATTGLFGDFVYKIIFLIQDSIAILFVAATAIFIAGLIRYLKPGDSEENVTKGRIYIVYGIITLFVMYSVWAIAIMISDTFFAPSYNSPFF